MNALEKIANGKRLPVLFIGCGISKRYLYKYPTWKELLKKSFYKIDKDPYQYQKYYDQLKREQLTDFEINAELGTIIEDKFNDAFFDRKIKISGTGKNPNWIKAGVSPYKMYLSLYFKNLPLNTYPFLQDELVKFKSLKNKISAVITTNYDQFLEKEIFSDDYKVFVNQNELFSYDTYNTAEIYKIHGSVTDANSIVITKKDYNIFNESRKLIIAKMLTLFSESPIIFMGYSFTDENVQNIISDFLCCLDKKQLENIDEHFVFISYKKGQNELREIHRSIMTSNGTTIPITDIETDNFLAVYDILNKITPGMSPTRIRETKRLVKNIVDSTITSDNPDSVIIGIDNLDNIDLNNKSLAIAIGYREHILSKIGYGILDDKSIYEDILYDNKHFEPEAMCIDRFKSLARTRLMPVFKYVDNYSGEIESDSKLANYVRHHDTIDKIISKNILKSLKSIPIINDLKTLESMITKEPTPTKKAGILLKNVTNFNLSDVRRICINLYEEDGTVINSTNFKRCVMYIDLMENYINKKKS